MTGTSDVAAVRRFRANLKDVYELMRFDHRVIEFVVKPLERISSSQTKGKITNRRHRVDHLIEVFKNIRANESLEPYYRAMHNQCLVLLVSYFAAAVRELFVDSAAAALDAGIGSELLDAEVKISARLFRESPRATFELIAEALADAKDMSFQDMQSIDRGFRKYLGVGVDRDRTINNIITAQACRHVIVHAGSVADVRLVNQVRSASPRSIKVQLVDDTRIYFTREEVREVAKEMLEYLRRLANAVEGQGIRLSRSVADEGDAS